VERGDADIILEQDVQQIKILLITSRILTVVGAITRGWK
jgi:hypothetical protein